MNLAVRVGYGPDLEDYNLDKKFTVKLSALSRVPHDPLTEAKIAAENIRRVLPGKPIVAMSGGLDSEVVASSFLNAGIDFEVATLRFDGGLNEDEIKYARQWCEQHGVKQTFYDLNVVEFLEFDGYYKYQNPYCTPALECCVHLWFIDQIRDNLVWGGEAFRVFHSGSQMVLQSISEIEAVIFRFMAKNKLNSIPNFHFSTTELAWSFFRVSLLRGDRFFAKDHDPQFLAEKIAFYKDCGFNVLESDRTTKLHGFEGVRRYFDSALAKIGLPDYDHHLRIPFGNKYPFSSRVYVDIPKEDHIARKILNLEA